LPAFPGRKSLNRGERFDQRLCFFKLHGMAKILFFLLDMTVGTFGRAFYVPDALLVAFFTVAMKGKLHGVEFFIGELSVVTTRALQFFAIVHDKNCLFCKRVVLGVMVTLATGNAKGQVLIVIEAGRFFPCNGNFLVRCF